MSTKKCDSNMYDYSTVSTSVLRGHPAITSVLHMCLRPYGTIGMFRCLRLRHHCCPKAAVGTVGVCYALLPPFCLPLVRTYLPSFCSAFCPVRLPSGILANLRIRGWCSLACVSVDWTVQPCTAVLFHSVVRGQAALLSASWTVAG